MSCNEANVSGINLEKWDEVTNKLHRFNKNVKLVLEWSQKLHEATEKKSYITLNSSEFKNKRAVYLTKLNNREIKNPKETTLQYYKIDYDEDTDMYSGLHEENHRMEWNENKVGYLPYGWFKPFYIKISSFLRRATEGYMFIIRIMILMNF